MCGMKTSYARDRTFEPFLTIGQVAECLAVSELTVRRIVHRGEIAAVRVGERQLRIAPYELEGYLERRRERTWREQA